MPIRSGGWSAPAAGVITTATALGGQDGKQRTLHL